MSRGRRTVVGLVLVVVGALLGLLALTALPWFRGSLGGVLNFGSRPSQLRQSIDFYQGLPDPQRAISFWVSPVFFGWLGLVLLLLCAVAAFATVGFDPKLSRVIGVAAAVLAACGVILTSFAIKIVNVDPARLFDPQAAPPGYLDYLGQTGIGAWAMALGFLVIAAGALLAAGGRDSFRTFLADDAEPGPDEPASSADPVAPATEVADVPVRRPREDW